MLSNSSTTESNMHASSLFVQKLTSKISVKIAPRTLFFLVETQEADVERSRPPPPPCSLYLSSNKQLHRFSFCRRIHRIWYDAAIAPDRIVLHTWPWHWTTVEDTNSPLSLQPPKRTLPWVPNTSLILFIDTLITTNKWKLYWDVFKFWRGYTSWNYLTVFNFFLYQHSWTGRRCGHQTSRTNYLLN